MFFFHVRISNVLCFKSICDLFTDSLVVVSFSGGELRSSGL
jgi:hypothetical protein